LDKVARMTPKDREGVFQECAARRGVRGVVIEKDFWVCWILQKLYGNDMLSKNIMFKGGTSLSKVFNVIERFSEDIDLVLNWNLLEMSLFPEAGSNKAKKLWKDELKQKSCRYVEGTIYPIVGKLIGEDLCDLSIDVSSGTAKIFIKYPHSFTDEYIQNRILLEIGPRSAWKPNAIYNIKPYLAEEFPEMFSAPMAKVHTIKAERTFWEKVLILHQEHYRLEDKQPRDRYSRHYYDVVMMCKKGIKDSALADLALCEQVVEFKKKFFPCSWSKDDLAKSGTFTLMPNKSLTNALKKDYAGMEQMIFGEYPNFDELLSEIGALEKELNS